MDFPTLNEMGIARPEEISHYTLRQEGDRNDVLKVHYDRKPGSLRPVTRKYRFGRATRSTVADSGTSRLEENFEISPRLTEALAELQQLVSRREETVDRKVRLVKDLDHLEKVVASKIGELRQQIESM